MVYGGRYMLLLMGAFAVYCGAIYNDFASSPLNLFGSAWRKPAPVVVQDGGGGEAGPHRYVHSGSVYPFGVDPVWLHSANGLQFFNSLKMKMSVILGVTQMTFGIFIGLSNNLYEKNKWAVLLESLPRFLFLFSLFGYMSFIILLKFAIDWSDPAAGVSPPNLVQTMIQMFLAPGTYLSACMHTCRPWKGVSE